MLQCQFVLRGCKYIQQCLHSLRPLFYFVVHSYMAYPFIHDKDLKQLQQRNMSSCRFSVLYLCIQYVSLGKTWCHVRKYCFPTQHMFLSNQVSVYRVSISFSLVDTSSFSPEPRSICDRISRTELHMCVQYYFNYSFQNLILNNHILVPMIISILFIFTCLDGTVTAFLLKIISATPLYHIQGNIFILCDLAINLDFFLVK